MIKTNGVSLKEKRALLRLKQLLLERFPRQILQIKLFGSKARSEAHKFSDVDVLVVIKKGDWRLRDQMGSVSYDVFYETGVDISMVVLEQQKYRLLQRWGSPFIANIRKEGISV